MENIEIPELTLTDVDEKTGTVEDFIQVALANDFEYEDIHEYLRTEHKG